MDLVSTLRRWAQLAGFLGLAVGSLAIQACTRASPGGADASTDASTPPDAATDTDAGVADAEPPRDADALDARLWDVICE